MKNQNKIHIGGFQKQSLIDYPGHLAAVIFTYGCNFHCNYCHNPQLIGTKEFDKSILLEPETLLDWIYKNRILLDAVVITGGEPTLHPELPDLIHQIRRAELKVKLDTNGTNPDMVEYLIKNRMIDYLAMDIKAPLVFYKYSQVVGEAFNVSLLEKIIKTIEFLRQGNIDFEFRTTCNNGFTIDDFICIAQRISGKYYIQNRIGKFDKPAIRIGIEELQVIKSVVNSDLIIELRNQDR